jgi:hypothetical protein
MSEAEFHTWATWLEILLAGVSVFMLGFGINLKADQILFNLRKPGDTGYKVPRGISSFLVLIISSPGRRHCPRHRPGVRLDRIGFLFDCWLSRERQTLQPPRFVQ